ncbi:MAG: hypothetical protein QE487_08180 [Fluviicola sp.]|nr:hypothetical protein [Fluviicola sp.]
MKRNKKWFRATLLAALCGGIYAFEIVQNAPVTISLEEAIAKKMVTCRFTSTGSYSGESVAVSVTNLTGNQLTITIPNGTVFKPSEDEDQDLIIVEQQAIALKAKATGNQVLDGYCMEASDHSPTTDNGMKLSKTTNSKLIELAAFVDKKGYDSYTLQDAIWAVSDGSSISNIDSDTEQGKALRVFLAKLTNQEDPWYETKQERVVTPERLIENNPISVNGKIRVESDGNMKIHEVVQKVGGEVKNNSSEMTFSRKGIVNYEFTLTVKGWEKGDYEVKVMNGDKLVQTFPFTI